MHGQIGPRWITGGALMLVGGLVAHAALAANFETCVQSDADLASALDTARTVPVTAKIVQHKLTAQNKAYDLKNTVWDISFYVGIQAGSEILGGYTAGCAARDIAAGNTLFIDTKTTPLPGVLPRGDLTIEGITFSAGFFLGLGDALYHKVPSGSTILLSRDAFINGNPSYLSVIWDQPTDSDSTVRIVDTLIANNGGLGFSCALYLSADSGAPEFDVINNTVANNAGANSSGACFYDFTASGKFYVYNNIFYGETGTSSIDLSTNTDQVVLDHNIFAARTGPTPIVTSGNLTADPNLDANYRPTELPQSNAINSGNNSVPDGLPSSDLDGGPRVVGAIVDRGAYESSIDPKPVQTVKNTNNGGADSLRAAITSTNSNGGGTIKFAFTTGSCPWVISLATELAPLVGDTSIEGYTASGAAVNNIDPGDNASICVILEADAGQVTPPAHGLVVNSNTVTIQGLGISGFSTAGIDLQGGSAHSVLGNHFGGNVGGHAMQPNGFDVRIGPGASDSAIGSGDIADRNIIGDAINSGIVLSNGTSGNQVSGNYIGLGWSTGSSSYTNRANGARGIYVAGDNNTISGNLIGFNAQAGIVLDSLGAHDNLISENLIGADLVGTNLGNTGAGIHLIGDSGGTGDAPNGNTIRFNTIADNGAQGVLVDVGQGNRVRKNSIYGNANLGIDLLPVGANFPQSDDGGLHLLDEANRSQNFPVLTAAKGGNENGTVAGSLTTTAGDYTIDFYNSPGCDPSGFGEGKSWLGGVSVTVPVPVVGFQGTYSFTALPISAPLFVTFADGSKITATATDANGNTSEFSACVNYLNDTLFTDGFEGPPPTI
ncbi:MAG TPA: right-handed parallel beta-helix repeat-containing protein [Rudaea sp.]|nr:right-handed parallel beta-helix repeat-containing protein [Rudaea sp.]